MAPDASWQSLKQSLGRILRLMTDCVGTVIILCAKDTIKERWVEKATARLDSSKIKYLDLKNL